MVKALIVKPEDTVAVALAKIPAGEKVSLVLPSGEAIQEVMALEEIPFAHKIAVHGTGRGEKVIRYGEVIGLAKEDIAKGRHVHVHNLQSSRFA